MGSPDFALPSLEGLMKAGYTIPLVLSQPDRPAGRGRKIKSTAVASYAREHALNLETPETLRDADLRARVKELEPDLFVVIAYRLLPGRFLRIPRIGSINLHASLLPYYRGAAPIQHAIMDGQAESGLSTFLIDRGVDTGGVLDQLGMPISENETAGELHDRMMAASSGFLLETVDALFSGKAVAQVQKEGEYPLAPKLTAETRRVTFAKASRDVHNHIRALAPLPGALCEFRGQGMKLLRSQRSDVETLDLSLKTGSLAVDAGRLFVRCKDSFIEILELAPSGRRAMTARAWLQGVRLEEGECFSNLN